MTLEGAITYLLAEMLEITDIKAAPNEPPLAASQPFPFVIAYPSSGSYQWTLGTEKDIHIIALELHIANILDPAPITTATPILKKIKDKIKADVTLNGQVDTVILTESQRVTYEMVFTTYGAVKTVAFQFRIPVKIME